MTCQSELENRSHDKFEQNDKKDLCGPAKKLIKPGGHGHVFFGTSAFLVVAKVLFVDGEKDGSEQWRM